MLVHLELSDFDILTASVGFKFSPSKRGGGGVSQWVVYFNQEVN